MSRYFSIDDIVSCDERVPVKWLKPVEGVAWLDNSLTKEEVPEGHTMDLPLWLAEDLSHFNSKLVEISLPPAYTPKSREDIKADPVAAKLRELSPHFYNVGLRLCPLLKDPNGHKRLSNDVREVLSRRAQEILSKARTRLGADVSAYRDKLTDLEQQVFDAASAFTAAKLSWRREEAGIMRPPAAALSGLGGGGGGR